MQQWIGFVLSCASCLVIVAGALAAMWHRGHHGKTFQKQASMHCSFCLNLVVLVCCCSPSFMFLAVLSLLLVFVDSEVVLCACIPTRLRYLAAACGINRSLLQEYSPCANFHRFAGTRRHERKLTESFPDCSCVPGCTSEHGWPCSTWGLVLRLFVQAKALTLPKLN